MIRSLLTRTRGVDEETGMALISVIAISAAVMILVAGMLGSSVSGLVKAQHDQNWDAAMAAAYAGVEDYQSKLANDNTYEQYGNSAAAFSSGSTFTSTDSNPAFGIGTSGTWATVAGSNGKASYRYEVDNSTYSTSGTLRLRSTGLVGNTTRSIVANLKQQGFIDFMYFTDYEIADPAVSSASCTPAYAWAVSSRPNCTTIQFAASDTLAGPVHSNDTMQICGTTFTDQVTSSNPAKTGLIYTVPSTSCPKPSFLTGYPKYSPQIVMPPTNTTMKQETRSDLTASTVPRPGCLYTGPTTITFTSDGKMTVRSPWTKFTNTTGATSNGGNNNSPCGTPGSATGQLGSPAGQSIPVPANNLIFVQTVPTATSDFNYTAPGKFPTGFTCSNTTGSTGTSNGLGYPAANEAAPSSSTAAPSYGCRNGDVFVQGKVHADVTVAADNYVYVVGDLTYANAQTDMLGLVGQNAVWVWNPVNSSNVLLDTTKSNREIDAAILSVAHTFLVQNNADGLKGTLTVMGAIAQKFRGAVAQGDSSGNVISGYKKNYEYDTRFAFEAPPKFLSPVSTTYGTTSIVEVRPAFNANGSAN
jgi:hypothetical protein